jgi:outer membrane lipoprotein-sorting protein
MNRKKLFILIAVLFLMGSLIPAYVYAQDAAQIVERSRNRIQAQTTSTRSRMVIRARNGSTTERVIDQYSKDDAQGNHRMVIVFQSPSSVSGTRFLTIENANRGNDQWIFQPSLGNRARRLVASEGSSSFLGTDLSNDDIASLNRKTDLDNHRLLREDTLSGRACYVIESVPKDSSYQYSKMILWVDKENYVNYRVELYDRRGTQVKLLEIVELREIQGRLTPVETRMTTLAAGTSTTIYSDIVRYDDNIPESVFTTEYLETGRAR